MTSPHFHPLPKSPNFAMLAAMWGKTRFRGAEPARTRAGSAWVAHQSLTDWASALQRYKKNGGEPNTSADLTRLLLRTAEDTSGLPTMTSGLPHGLEAAPLTITHWVLDGQNRLMDVERVIFASQGSGKTHSYVSRLLSSLNQLADRAPGSDPSKTELEIQRAANGADDLSNFLGTLAQRLISGTLRQVVVPIAVPPHASSPCGVLRLAASIVPGAPGHAPFSGSIDLALAA
ncbi:hypothetical protein ACFU6R_00745 [Streptomyces sp. NPDC057499]|uniref:hypothetical protein n=1 Tax=Streptomyces sp. NPDC057499 TaxID=3346150 RepID=UPI00368353E1